MKRIVVIFLLGVVLFSCGSKKTVVTKKSQKTETEEVKVVKKSSEPEKETDPMISNTNLSVTERYIETYKSIAQKEMTLYNIPASITLAQGILESASGKGRLSVQANNHFGIKCHTWSGAKIYHDDDKKGECFRKYNHAKYSYRDHSLFLTTRKRYASLFDLNVRNYKAWAKGLKAAGYATDRKYPQKLISLIERYKLYKYDDEVLGATVSRKENFNETIHVVAKGDTLYSISRLHDISVEELQQQNNLRGTTISIGQVLKIKTK